MQNTDCLIWITNPYTQDIRIANPNGRILFNMDYKSIYSRHSDYKSEWTGITNPNGRKTFGLQIRMDGGIP